MTITIFADLIDDLEEMAIALGFSSRDVLVRAYIGAGLREHESMQAAGTLEAQRKAYLGEDG